MRQPDELVIAYHIKFIDYIIYMILKELDQMQVNLITNCSYFLLPHVSTHLAACCIIYGDSFVFALVLFLH